MPKRIPFKKYWMIPIISIATAIGLNNVILAMNIARYSEAYQEAAQVLYAPSFAVQILYTGLLMPILEELAFRGVVFGFLRRKIGFLWAMLVSALLFGLYHGNIVQFIYATLCGLLLAYLYKVYGNILAPILAHVTMNIAANILTELGTFSWMLGSPLRLIVLTCTCALVACGMFVLIQKMDKNPVI